ncbi:cobalamin B12-binding domain-containing protein [Roseibacterium sp. SDUM158016]|uniref:cobalamin B12-binding domain-containing protein n=1 Tax=Roseicyclus sediminis TaxID=2980997 RepID=UPI0021CF80B1|nr:cobalamin B12-binding domain-containing protein [Roseibacterium sp. SDUM158016]MCU4652322.1 cobalamin B12-binding domain-containing protein [Roseibacterium sp. SDUM158016]
MNREATGTTGAALHAVDHEVARLAARAIAVVLSGRIARDAALEARLRLMCDAFLSERDETRHAVLSRLRQDGIPVSDIVDAVIPEVARSMGRRWAEDDISFADVTIGTARLQESVRALSGVQDGSHDVTKVREGAVPGSDGNRVLLIIPRPEHHTLGIFVAADQFHRFGYDVDFAIDKHPRQIAEMVRKRRYCLVGITAAGRRTLAISRELVDTIRASATRVTPIVLSGSIVAGGSNLKTLTGVDHVVPDVSSALRVCGLGILNKERAHVAP